MWTSLFDEERRGGCRVKDSVWWTGDHKHTKVVRVEMVRADLQTMSGQ